MEVLVSTLFRSLSRIAAASRGVSRRVLLVGSLVPTLALVGVVGTSAASGASAATPLPRIDLKVLLLGTSTTDGDFLAWQGALQREGVKFDALVGPSHTPITASTLSTTLSDGTPEAKYDAVIVSVANLTDCPASGPCVPDLSSSEATALEQYEHRFNIRQITVTGPTPPAVAAYGLNVPSVVGTIDGAPEPSPPTVKRSSHT